MHTKEMSELEGKFVNKIKYKGKCKYCKEETVYYEIWESGCGGFEDEKYTCESCDKIWWVEGPDA